MTNLTLYGSAVASSTLPTAATLHEGTGGSEVTTTTVGPASGNGYVEVCGLGAASSPAPTATLPAPTGKGWLFDSAELEGALLMGGSWAGTFAVSDASGTGNINAFVQRFFRRSVSGIYTAIGQLQLTNQTIHTTRTAYSFLATMFSGLSFGPGDKLYSDFFINANNWTSDQILIYLSTGNQGVVGDLEADTPGYVIRWNAITTRRRRALIRR